MNTVSRRNSSVALTIGDRYLSAVQVAASESGLEVTAHCAIECPRGAVRDGVVQDAPAVAQAVRNLWRTAGLRDRAAAVVLPTTGYFLRALQFPDIPERERRSIVRGELEQDGALPSGGGAFDFIWLKSADAGQADAYTFFASQAAIEGIREAIRLAGLQLCSVEPESVGLMRAYVGSRPRRPMALLCPASKHCDLCIHDGVQIRQFRRIPSGWDDLEKDEAAAEIAHAARPAAERQAAQAAFLGGDEPEEEAPADLGHLPSVVWSDDAEGIRSTSSPPPRPPAPRPAPRPPISHSPLTELDEAPFLVSEIARSLAFYAREHEDELRPSALVILGPSQHVDGIHALLDGSQGIPVLTSDLAADLHLDSADLRLLTGCGEDAQMLAAAGAAGGQRGFHGGIPAIDLSWLDPQARRRTAGARRFAVAGLAGGAAWLLASAVAATVLAVMEMASGEESSRLSQVIQEVKTARAPALRYHQVTGQARAAEARVKIPAGTVLGRVAAAASPQVALASLDVAADGKVSLSGEAASPRAIQNFALDIGRGQSLRLPVAQSIERDTNGRYTFRIVARFRDAAPKTDSGEE